MARKAVATKETVTDAVEALFREGLDPTVERVRTKLGGGSFTTISGVLSEVLAARRSEATAESDVPPDLAQVGQKAIQAIYAAVQRTASAKIEVIELDARKRIDNAQHALSEAKLEIERLEHEAEETAEMLSAAQIGTQAARERAERAEGQLEALTGEAQRTRDELERLRSETQRFRDELAKLHRQPRGQTQTRRRGGVNVARG